MDKNKMVQEMTDRFYDRYIQSPEKIQDITNRIAKAIGPMESIDLPAVVYALEVQAKALRKHPDFVDLTDVLKLRYSVTAISINVGGEHEGY